MTPEAAFAASAIALYRWNPPYSEKEKGMREVIQNISERARRFGETITGALTYLAITISVMVCLVLLVKRSDLFMAQVWRGADELVLLFFLSIVQSGPFAIFLSIVAVLIVFGLCLRNAIVKALKDK